MIDVIYKELKKRISKYIGLYLRENHLTVRDIDNKVKAWNIAHELNIPRECYHMGYNDGNIKTILRRNFPYAGF